MGLGIHSFCLYVCTVIFIIGQAGAKHARALGSLTFTNSFSNLVVCETTTITWQGGVAPYTLAWTVNDEDLETAVVINDDNIDWDIDIGPGTPVIITLADSNGLNATTSPFTTRPGTKTCDLIAGTLDGKPSAPPASTTPVYNTSPTNTSTQPSTPPKSSFTPNVANTTNTSLSPTPTPLDSPSGSSAGSKPTGPSASTIGFVILAVVLGILIAVLAFLWFKRRQRRRNHPTIDLLADEKFDPSFVEAQVIRPFTAASTSDEHRMVVLERPAEGSSGGHVLVTRYDDPFNGPTPQPTYTEKVAAMRLPRKGYQQPSFSTVRLESTASSSSGGSAGHSYRSSGYPPPNSTTTYPPSTTTSVISSPTSSRNIRPSPKSRVDLANAPSIRSAASEASEEAFIPTNESTASLLPEQGSNRREADGGVRLAGGPLRARESWFVGGGTLPPAYGAY